MFSCSMVDMIYITYEQVTLAHACSGNYGNRLYLLHTTYTIVLYIYCTCIELKQQCVYSYYSL